MSKPRLLPAATPFSEQLENAKKFPCLDAAGRAAEKAADRNWGSPNVAMYWIKLADYLHRAAKDGN